MCSFYILPSRQFCPAVFSLCLTWNVSWRQQSPIPKPIASMYTWSGWITIKMITDPQNIVVVALDRMCLRCFWVLRHFSPSLRLGLTHRRPLQKDPELESFTLQCFENKSRSRNWTIILFNVLRIKIGLSLLVKVFPLISHISGSYFTKAKTDHFTITTLLVRIQHQLV